MALISSYQKMLSFNSERSGECLLFGGPLSHGYGRFRDGKNRWLTHRLTALIWFGEIPNGLVVDHQCHNEASHQGLCNGGRTCRHRRCVNPAHLRLVENSVNMNSVKPASGFRTAHCKKGHERNAANSPKSSGRGFRCLPCEQDRTRKRTMAGEWKK